MNEVPKSMSCAEFQAQLPEFIGSGASAAEHPHLKECDLCRELLQNLEAIAEAARQLFPEVEPPEDLWENIESAIKKKTIKKKTTKKK
jgi:predicted anti-sigma-YlaC factor YlaD